jgi:hypothetical protein
VEKKENEYDFDNKRNQWLGVQGVRHNDGVHYFFMHGGLMLGRRLKRTRYHIWTAVVWCLWLARNRVIFEDGVKNCNSLISQIKAILWSWFIGRAGRKSNAGYSEWLKCPSDCLSNC